MDEESTMHDSQESKSKDLPIEARHSICLEVSKKMRQSVESSIFIPQKKRAHKSHLLTEIQPSKPSAPTVKQEMKIKKTPSSKKSSKNDSIWKKCWKLRTASAHKQRPAKQCKKQDTVQSVVPLKHPESYPIVKQPVTSDQIRSVVESLRDELAPQPARQTQVIAKTLQLGPDPNISISYTYEVPETMTRNTGTDTLEMFESPPRSDVGFQNCMYVDPTTVENSDYRHNQFANQDIRKPSSLSYWNSQAETYKEPPCRFGIKAEDTALSGSYLDQAFNNPSHHQHMRGSGMTLNYYNSQEDSQCLSRLRPTQGLESRESCNIFTTVPMAPSTEYYEANRKPQKPKLQSGLQFSPDLIPCRTYSNYNSVPPLTPELYSYYQSYFNRPKDTIVDDSFHPSRTISMNCTNYCRHQQVSNMMLGLQGEIVPTTPIDYPAHSMMKLNSTPLHYQKLNTNPQYYSESNLYEFVNQLNRGPMDLTISSLSHSHPPFHYPTNYPHRLSNCERISETYTSQLQSFTNAITLPDSSLMEIFNQRCWQPRPRFVFHDPCNTSAQGSIRPQTEIFRNNRLI